MPLLYVTSRKPVNTKGWHGNCERNGTGICVAIAGPVRNAWAIKWVKRADWRSADVFRPPRFPAYRPKNGRLIAAAPERWIGFILHGFRRTRRLLAI